MSKIMSEQLKAGIILGDHANNEYIYMPGGEVGTDEPFCVFEKASLREDLPLEAAVSLAQKLHLKPTTHPQLGKKSY